MGCMNPIYEPNAKLLVLSADSFNHSLPPGSQINHVPWTKIYGDGRVVFVDRDKGDSEISQGHLDAKQISHLFELLQAKGFFGFADGYPAKPGFVGVGADAITAVRRGQPEKQVTCCHGAPLAPRTFQDCFKALLYPQIQPSDVKSYIREPMIPPVDSCRHVRVSYNDDPAAGGTIQFDRNSMSPNEFGDIGMTTLMWCEPHSATYTLLETKHDKRLFSATVPGYSGAKLRLVVFGDPTKPSGGRLLELDDHDAIQNIHWLQAAPQS